MPQRTSHFGGMSDACKRSPRASQARAGQNNRRNSTLLSTAPRVSWLPEALKEGKADGVLVACHRPDGYSTSVELWWTYDPTKIAFSRLEVTTSFPAKGTLLSWHRVRASHWLLRVQMAECSPRAVQTSGDLLVISANQIRPHTTAHRAESFERCGQRPCVAPRSSPTEHEHPGQQLTSGVHCHFMLFPRLLTRLTPTVPPVRLCCRIFVVLCLR